MTGYDRNGLILAMKNSENVRRYNNPAGLSAWAGKLSGNGE